VGAVSGSKRFYLDEALELIRTGLAGLIASSLACGSSLAANRYVGFTSEHSVVRYDNQLGIYPPEQLAGESAPPTVASASSSWQSWSAAFVTTNRCGTVEPHLLILCADDQLKLSSEDQLRMLAFATPGSIAFVRTPRAESYLHDVLKQMPDRSTGVTISNARLNTCVLDCERVLILEK